MAYRPAGSRANVAASTDRFLPGGQRTRHRGRPPLCKWPYGRTGRLPWPKAGRRRVILSASFLDDMQGRVHGNTDSRTGPYIPLPLRHTRNILYSVGRGILGWTPAIVLSASSAAIGASSHPGVTSTSLLSKTVYSCPICFNAWLYPSAKP